MKKEEKKDEEKVRGIKLRKSLTKRLWGGGGDEDKRRENRSGK